MFLGLAVHRPRQRHQQIEHCVKEYRNSEHVAAGHQRRGAAFFPQQAEESSDDAVRRTAVHHALADDYGQSDDYADASGRVSKCLRHPAYLLGQIPRGEQTHNHGRSNQRNKRIHPQQRNHQDDGRHADSKNYQRV